MLRRAGVAMRRGYPAQLFCARVSRCTAAGQRLKSTHAAPLVRLGQTTNGVAELTLCRPRKLNSLSIGMIRELTQIYGRLGAAGVRCLLLRGEGRALCAGGDVAEVREGILEGTGYPADFFHGEYMMDYGIATLLERQGVAQVALWDGIVMGGGVGLSIHGPVRVATEKTLFAMPETAIGLFPDVGATHALSRLPAGEAFGVYLGCTGQRLGAADCIFAGLATHFCPSAQLGELADNLRSLGDRANDLEAISEAISSAAGGAAPSTEKATLEENGQAIRRCFGGATTAEEILARLEAEGEGFGARTVKQLRQRSPTSVKVSLEGILRHRSATLREAFIMEYRMSQWCMRPQPESDFCEGIRAVLVDRDNKPQWTPSRIEEVTKEKVDGFFAPLAPDHPHGDLPI